MKNTISGAGNIYLAESFYFAGDAPSNTAAKHDGTTWSALASGPHTPMFAVAVSGSDIYNGGLFQSVGGVSANRVAKWNDSS